MDAFCRALPKVELHAHLNGSLSCETVEKLVEYHLKNWPLEPMPSGTQTLIEKGKKGTFDDPFQMFSLVHSITDNTWAVAEATRDVIREFATDGVVYLELRTTPRSVPGRMTREAYCRAVIDTIKDSSSVINRIMVRLLLAIDRRRLEDMEDTIQLFSKLRKEYGDILVGLDISGDPRVGDIIPLIPRLTELRNQQGMKLAVHLAEIDNSPETLAFIKFGPERIGHGTFIHPATGGNETLWRALQDAKGTAVEVCLTSNVTCSTVPSYRDHHVELMRRAKVPFVLCTDDKGVFCCSLSGEYAIAADSFGWGREEMFTIAREAVQYIFATSEEKECLKQLFDDWRNANKELIDSGTKP